MKNGCSKKDNTSIVLSGEVPRVIGDEAASLCTEDACIQFAKDILKTDDVIAVNNQGSNSFTLQTSSTIFQFRLMPLKTDILALAHKIYGDLVPEVTLHDGFPLPAYSSKLIPGQVHLLQQFPTKFPLEREKRPSVSSDHLLRGQPFLNSLDSSQRRTVGQIPLHRCCPVWLKTPP